MRFGYLRLIDFVIDLLCVGMLCCLFACLLFALRFDFTDGRLFVGFGGLRFVLCLGLLVCFTFDVVFVVGYWLPVDFCV